MADHVRKQLRDAVVTAVTGLTTTGANVHRSRVHPIEVMPCLAVYASSEVATRFATLDAATTERTVSLRVEGFAEASADLEDVLDQIAKEVEIALTPALTIGSFTTLLEHSGSDITMRDDLARPCGAVVMSFEAVLYTTAPDTLTGA